MYFEVKIINPDGKICSCFPLILPALSSDDEIMCLSRCTGKFCIGLSGPDTNLAELMNGNNGNNKKERAQTKWTFIFESDQVQEKFKAGDVIVSQTCTQRTTSAAAVSGAQCKLTFACCCLAGAEREL